MDEPWKITYQIDRRDFWLDQYFTYFYHPLVRCVMWLLIGSMVYCFGHKLWLTHNLVNATASLIPNKLSEGLIFATTLFRIMSRMPSAGGSRTCSAIIDAQSLYCIEPEKGYRYSWKKVMAIRQTVEYILFFTWKGGTFTVPIRAFDSFEEAQQFYQAALYYKSAAKHGLPTPIPQNETVWPPAPRPGA